MKKKNGLSPALRLASAVLAAFMLMGCILPTVSAEKRTVRVGYFDFDGYHNTDADGRRSGYGYEYLQKIAEYTDWEYEYVDGTWEECQEMLKRGEIDILTSAQYTEERGRYFDFSDKSIGISDTIVTVLSDNTDRVNGDPDSLDGISVGLLRGNSRNQGLEEYFKKNGISYTTEFFSSDDELRAALESRQVDSIITSNLRVLRGERIVAEFNPSPYYVIVKKGDSELLDSVNYALEQIGINQPLFQGQLYQKYYGANNGGDLALTADEKSFLTQNGRYTVVLPPNMSPMIICNGDELKGIIPDLIRKAGEKSGLNLEFVTTASPDEYLRRRAEGDGDVFPATYMDYYTAECENTRLTSPYLTITFSTLSMLEHPTTERSFAVIGDAYSAGLPLVSRLEGGNIQSYLTVDECIKAVSTGKATDAVLITYTAQEIINNSYKKRFSTTILSDTSSEITCAVNKDSDIRLFSILSKSLESISDDEKREIIAAYTLDYSYTYTLTDFFFRYPIQSIIIIAAVFLLACGSLYLSSRISIAKRDLVISNSSARFGAMIYDSYDAVSEAELNTNTIYSMSFEDSKLEHKKIAMKIDESIRYALDHLVHPDDAKAFAEFFSTEAMKQHSLAPSRESLEIRMRENTSSEYHWNMLTAVGMAHDEAHSGSILILRRDIQNLKQLEEEKRRQLYDALAVAELANSAKTSFMSKMSHEIRTPLNAITSYMAIAKKSVSNPTKVTDCLTKAEFASKHLLSLINDVLDMSAIERGKLNINSGSFDFRLLITQLSAMFHSQSRQKNVRFETILNGISTERLIGDQMRLNQVLINLLSNAVKFTPSGGKIILEITQTSISEESVHLRFAVIDTGVGMSEDFMARIFKPFEQQDASISQNYGGTGLGLSICKNLITLMDGAIQVKSRMGEGTTFTVDLPFIRDSKSTLPSFASFGDICALVVDDDPESCEYTAMLMQTCGITSEYVLSGAEAIEKFRGKLFDLCIIDWKMPEMDGVETIRRLRDEHGIKVPIIVVSSYDYSEIQNAATAAGANFFATKPLFRSTVVDLLMNIYGRYDTKSSADDEKVDFRGKHILLADDNELNLEVATELLEDSGFIVDGARNGKEALDKFLSSEEEQYDLILLDVQMPIMDGHEACRRIRSSSHKRAKAIPIIAMTANAFTEDISAALSAGMNNHVAKPIDLPALLDMLKQYLGYDDADESNYSDE